MSSNEKKYSAPPIHVCTQCNKEFTGGTRCPYCGTEASPTSYRYSGPLTKSPTALWYLLPLFFALLGGIVAYVAVKDDDEEMANVSLMLSIMWTVVLFIIGWALMFR